MENCISFKFLKYGELLKLKLPFTQDGKNWTITRVKEDSRQKQMFVHISIKNFSSGKLNIDKQSFIVGNKQQLKIDNFGLKISAVRYSLLGEAFRRKITAIGNDIYPLVKNKYKTVLKIEESNVSEVAVTKKNSMILADSIIMASGDNGLEFYITGNKEANIGHIRMIDELQVLKLYIKLEGR